VAPYLKHVLLQGNRWRLQFCFAVAGEVCLCWQRAYTSTFCMYHSEKPSRCDELFQKRDMGVHRIFSRGGSGNESPPAGSRVELPEADEKLWK